MAKANNTRLLNGRLLIEESPTKSLWSEIRNVSGGAHQEEDLKIMWLRFKIKECLARDF